MSQSSDRSVGELLGSFFHRSQGIVLRESGGQIQSHRSSGTIAGIAEGAGADVTGCRY